ncbi:MAG: efflux RND transporter periplasmic adaptor subunit [Treponema sp.]|nr:efflux RND transporter periplasmic adaptor subunit [Treponema sp.]
MKKTAKSALTIASVMTLLMLSGCGKPAAKDAEAESDPLYAVTTYKTVAGNFDDYLEFGGDVASVNEVMVLPDQAGKVTNILVKVGDLVKKDQTIAYINPQRVGVVYNDNPVKAPIAGRITSLPVTIGSTVSQASSVAKVARTDELEIRISIAERFVSRIHEKQSATITLDSYPGVEFKAVVSEISPVIDVSTRTMAAKLKLDPPDPRVKVGMYARVKLVTKTAKNAIVVNNSTIVHRDGKPYLFVVDKHATETEPATVRLQPVTEGISVDAKTEITEGLNVGDEIVIKGQTLLNDGTKINIISTVDSL